jgi:hypothetical protein
VAAGEYKVGSGKKGEAEAWLLINRLFIIILNNSL